MLGHIDALTVLAFLVGLEFPVEGLEASQKMRYAAIGPKAFHPDVGTGIGLCVGSLVAESFSGQGLKRWFQFNITVHLFHALCKERGGVEAVVPVQHHGTPLSCTLQGKRWGRRGAGE